MDLSTLSVPQLRDLQQQIPAELKRRESEDKERVLNEARAFIKARGYTIEDLLTKEAVSYTHLDVYKRQTMRCKLFTAATRGVR